MNQPLPTEQSIFLIARQIHSEPERQAYLKQICGDDASLRTSVEALLSADAQSDDVLDLADKVAPTVAPSESAEQEGAIVGPYKLLERIGEGGMGVVFMAEQKQPVRRRVALKIIKPGMDSRIVIARFEAERQALAMMDHQNIARVLDAGETRSGRPYFVMELVKGVPVTEYCEANRLSLTERLELFQQVCHAIQHSHQKGIIHRDIKPNNVLVCNYDGKPVTKVIDFGVAKATHQQLTEKTLFTQHGQVVGTLEYMSPEQAELSQLDIDTRSDIYALGVLLYELLTGSTPITKDQIRSSGFVEVLRIIREEEAERPSTRLSRVTAHLNGASDRGFDPKKLGTTLRSELDWVILKALEKDRMRRYETVREFNADIGHFLLNEPVAACPPSALYRFRKFVRRHQTALSRVLFVATILVLLVGFGIWNRTATNQVRVEYEQKLAIDKAFRGQLGAALAHAAKADSHGADPVWTHMLTGIVELYKHHGSSESALVEFEQALQLAPDDVSLKSLSAIAYVWDGRWADHEKMLDDISRLELQPSDSVQVHFFLGQALMWSDPERSVRLLRHVADRWSDLPVVHMMLAEALGHWAWASGEERHAVEGIALANRARESMPDNASARALSNWVYMVAATLRRARGEPYEHYLDESADNMAWINQHSDYMIGYANRAWYYDLRETAEDRARANELWRQAVVGKRAGGWYASCYAAEMYRLGRESSRASLAAITSDPEDPDQQLARVFLLMDVGPEVNRLEAEGICRSVEATDRSQHCSDVQLMMWLRVGNLNAATEIAQRWKQKENQPNPYQIIAGELSAEELFQQGFDSRRVELKARLLTAMYQMAQGETERARQTLEPAVRFGGCMVVADPAHWVRAFYERPYSKAADAAAPPAARHEREQTPGNSVSPLMRNTRVSI